MSDRCTLLFMERDFYKTYFELEKSNWWFRVRRNIILSILEKYDIGKDNKILDYGCGSGFLVGQLQDKSLDAYGADISKEAIEFGTNRGTKNLSQLSGIEVNFSDGCFDTILAMDVIEHIEDDESVVKELERLLKPGSYLIITVPAYQWMWGVQDEVAHHYRRYTMSSVQNLITNNTNLKFLKKSYFNSFLFPPIALVRLISKWLNLKSRESDFDINNNFLNSLLYGIFNFESKFLRYINFPFGVSILLILTNEK